MALSREQENDKASAADKAILFEAAREEIEAATKEKKDGKIGRDLRKDVMAEGPVQDLERAYMEAQYDSLGLADSTRKSESVGEIDAKVRRQTAHLRAAGEVLPVNLSAQGAGNISSDRLSMNAAGIRSESEARREHADEESADEEDGYDAALVYEGMIRQAALQEEEGAAAAAQKSGGGISGYDYFFLFLIFMISLVADITDLVIDATGIGALFAPVKSLVTGIILTLLWWLIGGKYRGKNIKTTLGGTGIEAIPFLNIIPTNTLTCVISTIDIFRSRQ